MIKRLIRRTARSCGYDIVPYHDPSKGPLLPPDLSPDDAAVLKKIADISMTSVDRQATLVQAVRHLVRTGVAGCIVECGVYRGGSSMAIAMTLLQEKDTSRNLYLYDTYEGMTPPTNVDVAVDGISAKTHLERDVNRTGYWCLASIEDVQHNMASTNYPAERLHFIKGPVEKTIPEQSPTEPIALLRLDTDFYESTKHELIHLFPRLVDGGILIIDDYGHWSGSRKAVDEYFATIPHKYYVHRIDYSGRLLVKQ